MARLFKRELIVYQRVLRDERTPARAKIFLGLAIAYLCMPFDFSLPDFIPVIRHLDDAVIIPALVFLLRFALVPRELVSEHREQVIRDHAISQSQVLRAKLNNLSREIVGNYR